MPGIFLTFEGGEGAGKSTQIKKLAHRLEKAGHEVVITREPGGSPGAEAIRHMLLNGAAEPFGSRTEVMLFAAARLDHMRETILPALIRDAIVLCDRFYDSTRAYQGAEQGVSKELLSTTEALAVGGYHPDLTIILDIDPKLGLERVKSRLEDENKKTGTSTKTIDRFEKDSLAIQKKRRNAFLAIAKNEPHRCTVIDASGEPESVSDVIWSIVHSHLIEEKSLTSRLNK